MKGAPATGSVDEMAGFLSEEYPKASIQLERDLEPQLGGSKQTERHIYGVQVETKDIGG